MIEGIDVWVFVSRNITTDIDRAVELVMRSVMLEEVFSVQCVFVAVQCGISMWMMRNFLALKPIMLLL